MKKVKRYQTGGMSTVSDTLSSLEVPGKTFSAGATNAGASAGIDQISQGMDTVNQSMNTVSDAIYGGAGSNVNVGKSGSASNFMYKKGGMVSSASKRADGCAIKGKTRGKFV